MGPELLQGGRLTEESDRYALGMVILEVLSGQVPFMGDNDFVVVRKVTDGERPKRSEEVWSTDDMWGILEGCWAQEPWDRPSLKDVLQYLEEQSVSWPMISHLIPLTANSSKKEHPDQGRALTMDTGHVTSPSREVMSQLTQEPITHGTRSEPEDAQVWPFACP